MTKRNDQLLPCPFCGDPNPNLTHDDYVHDDLRPMPVVECTKCHTWVRAEAWNRRAQLPAGGAVPVYGKYVTRCGEMVAGIALRQLGAEKRWVEIRDLNAHAFPGIGANDMYPPYTELIMPAAAPHPVSGEQKEEFYIDHAVLRAALGNCGIAAPESDSELGDRMASYAKQVVRSVSKRPAAQDVSGLDRKMLEELLDNECGRSGELPVGDPLYSITLSEISTAVENYLATHRAQAQGGEV